jgi:hypothetical protein
MNAYQVLETVACSLLFQASGDDIEDMARLVGIRRAI